MKQQGLYQCWRLAVQDEVLWAYFDKPGAAVNTLDKQSMEELNHILDQLQTSDYSGLVIASGKAKGFIAGADIQQFTQITQEQQGRALLEKLHNLFNKLEALPIPTVALIQGFCMGGGLELALCCRYRIAEDLPQTVFAFPEVRLGIYPGAGGSARAPQVIGPRYALEMMLTGKNIPAFTAKAWGLVDALLPRRQLERACQFYLRQRLPVRRPAWYHRILNQAWARPLLYRLLQHKLQQKVNEAHYPAPFALLKNWLDYGGNKQAMLQAEINTVAQLILSPTAQNLVRVFFLQGELKHET